MRKSLLKFAGAGLAILLASNGVVFAASEREVNDIIKSLAPIAGQTVSPGYPSGSGSGGGSAGGGGTQIIIDQETIYVDYAYSIELEVYFPFDSAELTPRARGQLEALGRALESDALRPYRYLIAGHTDAKGSAAYNEQLSWRRSKSVKNFLVESFAVDPGRLRAKGWGESRLKDPAHPNAGINRRVEVVLIRPLPAPATMVVPEGGMTGHSTTIVVPPQSNVTVTVEPGREGDAADRPAAATVPTTPPATGAAPAPLPPCSIFQRPDPRNPNTDLDDFKARPGINCDPNAPSQSGLVVQPDGSVKIPW
ncbi:MAG: OmpA family protein [Hyphomicrobiales bacterium]|nr:OmpA family protein [Hyphomicrobiales bacterium]